MTLSMKQFMTRTTLLVSALFASQIVMAEQPYAGADLQIANITGGGNSVNIGSINVRLGTNFLPHVGAEIHMSRGIMSDSFYAQDSNNNIGKYTVKNNGQYGAYLKLFQPLHYNWSSVKLYEPSVYALVGANYADFKRLGPYSTAGNFGTSFSAGVGVTAKLDQKISVSTDLMMYEQDIIAINFGARYRF